VNHWKYSDDAPQLEVSLAEPYATFGFPEVRVGGLPAAILAF